jgi:hypothetical protein
MSACDILSASLPGLLLAYGRRMPRKRYQRPEVYLWKGRRREILEGRMASIGYPLDSADHNL